MKRKSQARTSTGAEMHGRRISSRTDIEEGDNWERLGGVYGTGVEKAERRIGEENEGAAGQGDISTREMSLLRIV